jgi:hypothetical protein
LQVEDHDLLNIAIAHVKRSHKRGSQGHFAQHLIAAAQAMSASGAVGQSQPVQRNKDGTKLTIPCIFTQQQDDTCEAVATTDSTAATATNTSGVITLCPPASTDPESYNIVKFYSLDGSTVRALLRSREQAVGNAMIEGGVGLGDVEMVIAFKATAKEHKLIYMEPTPPQSMLLLGRSGTGKTTV